MKSSLLLNLVASAVLVLGIASSTVAQQVVSTLPEQNALDVGFDNMFIMVTFDREVKATSIKSSSFQVIGDVTGEFLGNYDANANTAVFTSPTHAYYGETITVILTGDIRFEDLTSLTNGFQWSFTYASCGSMEFDDYPDTYPTKDPQLSQYKPQRMMQADFNGDGWIDVATSDAGFNLSVLLNDGNGGFSDYNWQEYDNVRFLHPCAADFDGDGDVDLFAQNYEYGYSWGAWMLENDGAGNFSPLIKSGVLGTYCYYLSHDEHSAAVPADMDNDGDMDVVVVMRGSCNSTGDDLYNTPVIGILYNDGQGSFAPFVEVGVLQFYSDGAMPRVADFNNDGWMDLLAVDYFSEDFLTVYLNDGFGEFSEQGQREVPYSSNVIVEDFDGDGFVDIACPGYNDDDLYMLINSGNGVAFELQQSNGYRFGRDVTGGDFDGDGDMDLASLSACNWDPWRESIWISLNNGDGSFEYATEFGSDFWGDLWHISSADIDGDKSMDIIASCDQVVKTLKNYGALPAPVLLSPDDGEVYDEVPANPTLRCLPVDGADGYVFTVYESLDLSTLVTSSGMLPVGTIWTVELPLGARTYYWRVCAVNACSDGRWSPFRRFVVDDGSSSSCPVLFSFDGKAFVKDNPLLTACERSNYAETVTDYYQVTTPVVARNGEIVFQLREMTDEISYVDEFELITVDHSAKSKLGCSVDGQIFSYKSTANPQSALDEDGTDWAEALATDDGSEFTARQSGSLVLTFSDNNLDGPVSFPTLRKLHPGENPGGGPAKLVADDQPQPNSFMVEQLMTDNQWISLADMPTRDKPTTEYIMPLADGAKPLTIRITWEGPFSADRISQCVTTREPIAINNWSVNSYDLQAENASAKSWLGFNQGGTLELRKGESVELAFDVVELNDPSVTRSYIVRAVGRYELDDTGLNKLVPNGFKLFSNYPNPFNPSTEISFSLPHASHVNLEIFNIMGQKISTLVNREMEAGFHTVTFDGGRVASGVYLYRLETDEFEQTKKMMLVK